MSPGVTLLLCVVQEWRVCVPLNFAQINVSASRWLVVVVVFNEAPG